MARLTIRTLVLLPALILAAPAATISFTFNGTVGGSSVRRSLDGGVTWGNNQTVGQMSVTATAINGGYGSYASFMTFCIEPQEGISGGNYTYDINSLDAAPTNVSGGMGSVKADLLRELYAVYHPDFRVTESAINGAALQLATWEIVRETSGTYNVSSGSIRFQDATTPNPNFNTIITTANAMLAAITPVGGPLLANLYAIQKVGNQDLAFYSVPGVTVVVPEPASLVLLSSGILVVWRLRRLQQ